MYKQPVLTCQPIKALGDERFEKIAIKNQQTNFLFVLRGVRVLI